MLDIQTDVAKNGEEIIKVNGVYLHSPYNPTEEAKYFVKKHYRPADIQLLIGYGKGYIYRELSKQKNEDEEILVLEPLLKNIPDVVYVDDENQKDIEMALRSAIHVTDSVNIIVAPNYEKMVASKIKDILLWVKEHLYSNIIIQNTLNSHAEKWYMNFLNNCFYAAMKGHPISDLYYQHNMPIVIASGGPSLTKQLALLKKYRNQIILLCSGTTINSLLKEDIVPDYLFSVDGSKVYYEHFKNISADLSHMKLVYSMEHYYKIGPLLNSSEAYFFVSEVFQKLSQPFSLFSFKELCTLAGGGSVANYVYALALKMTTGNIAFIGQDLAYTNFQTHAENNLNRKKLNEEEIKKRGLFYTEGYSKAEKVLTDHPFYQMKKSFEILCRRFDGQNRTFNCTEGGILIEEFMNIPFQQFLERNCGNNCDDQTISKTAVEASVDRKKVVQGFATILSLLDELEKILKQCVEKIIHHSLLDHAIVDFLGEQDPHIQKLMDQTGIGVVFQKIDAVVLQKFRPKLKETDQEIYNRVYDQNYYLYNEMYKKTIEVREKVKKTYDYYQKER